MSDQTLENAGTGTAENTQAKTYTQEEFDAHMAGLRASLTKKLTKQYEDLGDIEELRQLKAQAEKTREEQALKRGEFDRVIQELAAKKDAEIQKRDQIIKDYRINTPLLSAAAELRAVAPEQVRSLLASNLRLNAEGEVEVVDQKGAVRYSDKGTPLGVTDLVREFLDSNPHFVQATPTTTNTKSNVGVNSTSKVDLSSLDMKRPEHRKIYAEAMSKGRK